MLIISWIPEQLFASQKGLRYMESDDIFQCLVLFLPLPVYIRDGMNFHTTVFWLICPSAPEVVKQNHDS
jgi:hypothetical protein